MIRRIFRPRNAALLKTGESAFSRYNTTMLSRPEKAENEIARPSAGRGAAFER
jgi:hypothetical protein